MRHRAGTAERIGDRDPGRKTLRREPSLTRSRQNAFSPPNRCAQPVISSSKPSGGIEPDQRRDSGRTSRRSRRASAESASGSACSTASERIHGARVGECHAGLEPQARRGVVERRDAQRRLDRSNDDERLINWRGRRARDPIGREAVSATPTDSAGEDAFMVIPGDEPPAASAAPVLGEREGEGGAAQAAERILCAGRCRNLPARRRRVGRRSRAAGAATNQSRRPRAR